MLKPSNDNSSLTAATLCSVSNHCNNRTRYAAATSVELMFHFQATFYYNLFQRTSLLLIMLHAISGYQPEGDQSASVEADVHEWGPTNHADTLSH